MNIYWNAERRSRWTAYLFFIAVSVLYVIFLFPEPEYPGLNKDDGSWFLVLGRNVAQHWRYTMDTMVVGDWKWHATWPPAFPLYLACVVAVFGSSWVALKLAMALTGIALLFVLWRYWKPSHAGIAAVILVGLNPYFFLYSHHTMTEVPYMLMVAVTLLSLELVQRWPGAALAGLLGSLAFLTRGYAVTLLPAGAVYLLATRSGSLRERSKLCLSFALPMVIAMALWAIYSNSILLSGEADGFGKLYGNGTNILASALRSLAEHIRALYWHNARYAGFLMVPLFSWAQVSGSDVLLGLSVLLAATAAVGWARSLSRDRRSADFWFPLAVGLVLTARVPAARYWLPLLPFLLYYTFSALMAMGNRWLPLRPVALGIAGALAISAAVGIIWHLSEPSRLRFFSSYGGETSDLVLWINDHLPADAVIITESPADIYGATGRRAFPLAQATGNAAVPPGVAGELKVYLLCPLSGEVVAHYKSSYGDCTKLLALGRLDLIWHGDEIGFYRYTRQTDGPRSAGTRR